MRQRALTILFAVHSWAGIVTGVLLFVVCFSGAVVVFKHEIDLWANPSLRLTPFQGAPASLDGVLAHVARRYPGSRPEAIDLPDEVNPGYFVFVRTADGSRVKLAARGGSGELVGPVDSQLGQFLRNLHVFLFFGPRWIVGALGVAMLVLIGTGFFLHRKILKELFTLRWRQSFRVVTSDLHKALAIWGLAFHLVIALTGAWLGLAPLFVRAADHVAGTAGAEQRRLAGEPDSRRAQMVSLDGLLARARKDIDGFEPRFVALRNWGRADATARISGSLADHLASTAWVLYASASGELRERRDPRERGFWSQVNGLMEPLHYGDFGGLWLKSLYFLLGLSPAFLSLTGTLIWLDRRKRRAGAGSALIHA
jgi:uncharacterized iron-regulated membrane protein